jgi:glycosyltransferase involved in cell wall biosynthesis
MERNQVLARTGLAPVELKHLKGRILRSLERAPRKFPSISIIIPAHNEQDYLAATLAALNRQDYPEYEIVVVANGCTDRTAEVANGKCQRLVTLEAKGLGVSRNLGARLATGDLLKGQPDSPRFAYRLIYWLKNFIHRFVVRNGSSGVILCWKKHFASVGGFDERLELRENSELIRRLKRFGNYKYIGATAAVTSMRRYDRRGVKNIVWLWIKLWFLSLFSDLRHRKYESVR